MSAVLEFVTDDPDAEFTATFGQTVEIVVAIDDPVPPAISTTITPATITATTTTITPATITATTTTINTTNVNTTTINTNVITTAIAAVPTTAAATTEASTSSTDAGMIALPQTGTSSSVPAAIAAVLLRGGWSPAGGPRRTAERRNVSETAWPGVEPRPRSRQSGGMNSGNGTHVLVVDDEPTVREVVVSYLRRDGHTVSEAADGPTALRLLDADRPDLVVLDMMLPGVNGLDILRRIRAAGDTPVIMLTARAEESDRVAGLELGADDYVVKPFSPRELAARVNGVLRRSAPKTPTNAEPLEFDGLSIDPRSREVRLDGALVELTPKEFEVLAHLAAAPRQVFLAGRPVAGRVAVVARLAGSRHGHRARPTHPQQDRSGPGAPTVDHHGLGRRLSVRAVNGPTGWRMNRLGRRFMWASLGVLAVAVIMIVIAAQQMFINDQDLGFLLWIMIPATFAAALAAYVLSAPIARDAHRLSEAATRVAEGDLRGAHRCGAQRRAGRRGTRVRSDGGAPRGGRAGTVIDAVVDLARSAHAARCAAGVGRGDPGRCRRRSRRPARGWNIRCRRCRRSSTTCNSTPGSRAGRSILASAATISPRWSTRSSSRYAHSPPDVGSPSMSDRARCGGGRRGSVAARPGAPEPVRQRDPPFARARHDPHVDRVDGDREVDVVVADEGTGFPAEFRAIAFDPFTRGDPARNVATGTAGLGWPSPWHREAHGGSDLDRTRSGWRHPGPAATLRALISVHRPFLPGGLPTLADRCRLRSSHVE